MVVLSLSRIGTCGVVVEYSKDAALLWVRSGKRPSERCTVHHRGAFTLFVSELSGVSVDAVHSLWLL